MAMVGQNRYVIPTTAGMLQRNICCKKKKLSLLLKHTISTSLLTYSFTLANINNVMHCCPYYYKLRHTKITVMTDDDDE